MESNELSQAASRTCLLIAICIGSILLFPLVDNRLRAIRLSSSPSQYSCDRCSWWFTKKHDSAFDVSQPLSIGAICSDTRGNQTEFVITKHEGKSNFSIRLETHQLAGILSDGLNSRGVTVVLLRSDEMPNERSFVVHGKTTGWYGTWVTHGVRERQIRYLLQGNCISLTIQNSNKTYHLNFNSPGMNGFREAVDEFLELI